MYWEDINFNRKSWDEAHGRPSPQTSPALHPEILRKGFDEWMYRTFGMGYRDRKYLQPTSRHDEQLMKETAHSLFEHLYRMEYEVDNKNKQRIEIDIKTVIEPSFIGVSMLEQFKDAFNEIILKSNNEVSIHGKPISASITPKMKSK